MPSRIRRGDTVRVVAGKDRGKEGRVLRVLPQADRVAVEGVNVVTKHRSRRMTREGAQEGGITHEEAPLHESNVMPVCPSCDTPTRVGTTYAGDARVRLCRSCKEAFSS